MKIETYIHENGTQVEKIGDSGVLALLFVDRKTGLIYWCQTIYENPKWKKIN